MNPFQKFATIAAVMLVAFPLPVMMLTTVVVVLMVMLFLMFALRRRTHFIVSVILVVDRIVVADAAAVDDVRVLAVVGISSVANHYQRIRCLPLGAATFAFWSTFTLQHPLHVDKLVLDLDLSGLQHLLVQRIDGCAIPQIVPVLDELERVTRIERAEELNLNGCCN